MSEERLIKSVRRVKEHGEVFTPKQVVKVMIDQPELQKALHSLQQPSSNLRRSKEPF